MKWHLIKDKLPPLGEKLVFACTEYRADKKYDLSQFFGYITRPFNKDTSFNPEYYELHAFNLYHKEWRIERVNPYIFWLETDLPDHPEYAEYTLEWNNKIY